MGWNISPKHYVQWKNNIGKSFKASMIRAARDSFYNSVTKKSIPNPNAGKMRLQSTAVYGRTIFWKTINKNLSLYKILIMKVFLLLLLLYFPLNSKVAEDHQVDVTLSYESGYISRVYI